MISAKELIQKCGLTEREVHFIISYYFDGYFEIEIAKEAGCSRPLVSVVLKKARHKIQCNGFPLPRRIPRPEENFFDPEKLNTLQKTGAGHYHWLEKDRNL